MRYYLIAGESSGDKYGALLMAQLKNKDPHAEFRYWGGPKMEVQAKGQVMSIRETSFMGLWEVLLNLSKIRRFFKKAKESIRSWNPDIIIFIDYPGFNLRMAKWAKKNLYKTAYYISPQIWAWRKYRYKTIKNYVDLFFPILPFEKAFYHKLELRLEYHGHPLIEIIPKSRFKDVPVKVESIGFFPGSRQQEIDKNMPVMIALMRQMPGYKFLISGIDHLDYSVLKQADLNYELIFDFDQMIQKTDMALACSGTVSLELALYNIPQVVMYITSTISYQIAKRFVDVKYISLVNLIAGREIVKELIQEKANINQIESALVCLMPIEIREKMAHEYLAIRAQLGDGSTSQKIAQSICSFLQGTT